MNLTYTVRSLIRQSFDDESSKEVIRTLDQAVFPMAGTNLERIHIALVLLSRGDLNQFTRAVATAKQDWRDVLMGAGLANQNWREVAKTRGVVWDERGWFRRLKDSLLGS